MNYCRHIITDITLISTVLTRLPRYNSRLHTGQAASESEKHIIHWTGRRSKEQEHASFPSQDRISLDSIC